MHTQKNNPAAGPGALTATVPPPVETGLPGAPAVRRITSAHLLQDRREVEIEHGGKVYRLRVTQLNKLILTA